MWREVTTVKEKYLYVNAGWLSTLLHINYKCGVNDISGQEGKKASNKSKSNTSSYESWHYLEEKRYKRGK